MEHKDVPYIVHEGIMTRLERTIERLWILAIILIILLFGSNAGWIWYESQYVDNETIIEAEQDGEGINVIGGGDVNYGAEGQDNEENPEQKGSER